MEMNTDALDSSINVSAGVQLRVMQMSDNQMRLITAEHMMEAELLSESRR